MISLAKKTRKVYNKINTIQLYNISHDISIGKNNIFCGKATTKWKQNFKMPSEKAWARSYETSRSFFLAPV